jgi:hypothetical protein
VTEDKSGAALAWMFFVPSIEFYPGTTDTGALGGPAGG